MGLTDEESAAAAATSAEIRKQRGIAKGKGTRKLCILRGSIERGDPPEMLKDVQ